MIEYRWLVGPFFAELTVTGDGLELRPGFVRTFHATATMKSDVGRITLGGMLTARCSFESHNARFDRLIFVPYTPQDRRRLRAELPVAAIRWPTGETQHRAPGLTRVCSRPRWHRSVVEVECALVNRCCLTRMRTCVRDRYPRSEHRARPRFAPPKRRFASWLHRSIRTPCSCSTRPKRSRPSRRWNAWRRRR